MLVASILAVHVLVILFNLAGLVVIPLGAWRGWRFVHSPVLRLLHLASLAVVALQALFGRACFLTVWQASAEGAQQAPQPMIVQWVNSLVYWDVPLWVFTIGYCAIFAYALALLWFVPLRRNWR